jgi:hypothetical protein
MNSYEANCREWEERIALHAGGDLSAAEGAAVELHMRECPGCQLLWSGLKESRALLETAHALVPDAAHFTAVRSRVMAEVARGRHPWRRLAWLSAWVSGATAVAVLLLLAVWPARVVPEAPRMLAWIPPAPEVVKARPVVRQTVRLTVRNTAANAPRREPITVKFQTADPNIVIYWIAD